jgi:MYXO-CTERM domain-containing protein
MLLATAGDARADLTVTFNTTSNGGQYAPNNVIAGWIEGPAMGIDSGPFVKTTNVYATIRKVNLIAWNLVDPGNMDAVSGATMLDHIAPVTLTWNLRDRNLALVKDGVYRIRIEMADSNATTAVENVQGAFIFTVGPNPEMQTGLTSGGGKFTNATVDFKPVLCSNGIVDPGETCDSAINGSCPGSCPTSMDACAPIVLVGATLTCDAACETQPISACLNDDGCCAAGCTAIDDNDCEGIDQNSVGGGCETTSSGGGVALGVLGLGLLLARRRR